MFLAPRRRDAKGLADARQRGLGFGAGAITKPRKNENTRTDTSASPSSSFVISRFRAFVISLALRT